jgi:hypothetical protein
MSTPDVPLATKAAQVRLIRVTPSHRRVVLDNPPVNLMGPEFVLQIREIVTALEQGLQKPGDSENRLGFYVGQLGLEGEHS